MATQILDPWDSASNPASRFSNEFWGVVKIDAWLAALVKGTGKVPYDPAVHEKPATALDIAIIPLIEMNVSNTKACERHIIAESDEWRKIGWESLKGLGITSLRDVCDRFVRVEAVPTGQTYQSNGATYDRTMFKFIKLFANEKECAADYLAENPAQAAKVAPAPTVANGNGNGEKAAAWEFAKVIVANKMKECVGKPLAETMSVIGAALAMYPGVCKFYTVQSPEIVELMMNGGMA